MAPATVDFFLARYRSVYLNFEEEGAARPRSAAVLLLLTARRLFSYEPRRGGWKPPQHILFQLFKRGYIYIQPILIMVVIM